MASMSIADTFERIDSYRRYQCYRRYLPMLSELSAIILITIADGSDSIDTYQRKLR